VLSPDGTSLVPATATPEYKFTDPNRNQWAPRVGAAYRLKGDWVIRGGIGVYYSPATMNALTILSLNPRFSTTFTSALTPAMMAHRPLLGFAGTQVVRDPSRPVVRLAVLGNNFHLGSSLQTITDRFLVGYPWEGDWHVPNVQVVSIYLEPKPAPEIGPAYGPGRVAPKVEHNALAEGPCERVQLSYLSEHPRGTALWRRQTCR
jgi:hypothetical protein